MSKLRTRLTYANVVSTLCLFILLGGSAFAAVSLKKNSVRSKHIRNGQVQNVDLGPSAVDSAKVGVDSLTGADLVESSLSQVPSAASAVGADRVGPNGVPTGSIEDGAVNATKLGPVVERQQTVSISDAGTNGGAGSVTVSCLEGEQLLGGGAVWSLDPDSVTDAKNLHLVFSRPRLSDRSWLARGWNDTGSDHSLTVRALCLQ